MMKEKKRQKGKKNQADCLHSLRQTCRPCKGPAGLVFNMAKESLESRLSVAFSLCAYSGCAIGSYYAASSIGVMLGYLVQKYYH